MTQCLGILQQFLLCLTKYLLILSYQETHSWQELQEKIHVQRHMQFQTGPVCSFVTKTLPFGH